MSQGKTHDAPEKMVTNYFALIKELRAGKEGAVEKLVDMWDEDGVFEFAGAPPVTGTFRGRNAIHTLYKNRFHSSGMHIAFESETDKKKNAALGAVDTEVHQVRLMAESIDSKAVAGWTTRIETNDGRGFDVSGAHTFTFRDGRINTLKVVVSPKPEPVAHLSMKDLTVHDIGALSKAAWAVV